ncbi:cell wall surface anchored protein [Fibrisoma limi BUZ 3]|uniref:Cell wall surface anchored protein n=1 Tax=Fibrisoma limi BUZ 3 TaxID=1185876 RepID=I2GDR8_9BACT|nr:SdrD B-like domain-containing protein [Fibrisoma limi]CCH52042.1 cell wall surface anchored protein [Fibrisoma limi BUZ 3]
MEHISSYRLLRLCRLWLVGLLVLLGHITWATAPGKAPTRLPAPMALGLGDRVFDDLNRNGIQDTGEPGIANLPIRIYLNGIERGTTTTDANGTFSFTNANVQGGLLPNTVYELRILGSDFPDGRSITPRQQGSDNTADSDAQLIGGNAVVYAVTSANDTPTNSYDFGFAAGNPDLAISKVADTPQVSYGSNASFTIQINNIGQGTATNVVVRDTLDPGFVYVSSTPTATVNGNILTWNLGNVAPGSVTSLSVTATAQADGVLFNAAGVSTTDSEDFTRNNSTRACISVPIVLCPDEAYIAQIPAEFTNVEWFKDGGTTPIATGNSFTIVEAGSYRFTTTTNFQCPAGGCCPIVVEDGIIPDLAIAPATPAICIGETISLTATGCTSGTIAWSTGETTASIQVAPTTTSTYSVTCTSTQRGVCTASASTTVTVNQIPELALTSATICAGESATLTASTGFASYTFSAGATQIGSTNQAIVSTAGTYTVTATTAEGCTTVATGTVIVNPIPELALTSATICAGESATLTASTGFASYTFSAGATQIGTSNQAIVSTAGTYTVTATTAEGCTTVATGTVIVNPIPELALTSATICAGESATLTASTGFASYTFSAGATQIGSTNQAIVSTAGTYTVTATTAEGCTTVATGTVIVNPIPELALTSATICAGESATLTASTGFASYTFSAGATQIGSTNQAIVSTAGTYTVTATTAEGCTTVATGILTVNPAPVAAITPTSATVCEGESVTLTASGGTSYLWSTSETTATISVTATGVYSVTVSNEQGCSDVASTTITVNPTPVLTVSSATICAGSSTTLTVGGCEGGTLVWSTGDNTASLVVAPTLTTTYSATCTFTTGCSSTTAATVTVSDAPSFTAAPIATPATCNGATANNNARITLSTLVNTERADIVAGATYAGGPAYGAPTNVSVVNGTVVFENLPNPTTAQPYTVRLFSAGGSCFIDVTVTLQPADCQCPAPKCVPVVIQKTRRR